MLNDEQPFVGWN